MTLRLSSLFEEQLKTIFKGSSSRSDRPARGKRNERRRNHNARHSHTNGGASTSRAVRHHISDEDEEIDVVNGDIPSTSTGRPMRQSRVRQSNQLSNGVSTSHMSQNEAGPSGYRNKRLRGELSENESSEPSESESSNASENYDPTEPKSTRKRVKKKERRRPVNGTALKRSRRFALRESSDDDQPAEAEAAEEEEEVPLEIGIQNGQRRSTRGRPKKNQINASDEESENDENEENDDEEENGEENDSDEADEEQTDNEEEQSDEGKKEE